MHSATRSVHPLFGQLFLDADADDHLAGEQTACRTPPAKRGRMARLVSAAFGHGRTRRACPAYSPPATCATDRSSVSPPPSGKVRPASRWWHRYLDGLAARES